MNNPIINILILNWNNRKILLECINSIKESTFVNYKITVIDNGSNDNSIEFIQKKINGVNFIKIKNNLGYAKGYNYAFSKLKDDNSEWFLILNNDTRLFKNTLEKFVKAIDFYGNNYIYGCKILNINNNTTWYAGGKINFFTKTVSHRGLNSNDLLTSYKTGITDFVSGCCMLINKDLIYNINGFDEKYNFYYEDVDLCLKAENNHDIKSFYLSDVSISHHVSYSLGGRISFNKTYKKSISFLKFLFFNNNIILFIYYLIINIIFFPIYLIAFLIRFSLGQYENK